MGNFQFPKIQNYKNMQTATVKTKPQNTQTKFGQRSVVQFYLNGQIVKVWSDMDDVNLFNLNIGDKCEIKQKGRNYELIKKVNSFQGNSEPQKSERQIIAEKTLYKALDKSKKKEMVKEIDLQAKIWKCCLEKVCDELQDYNFSDENIRAITTTIYIKVTKPI